MTDQKIFSLLQVSNSIKKTLSARYGSTFWVKAEMNKLNHYQYSGHCYPELVEKENGRVIAQMNGILWKNDYLRSNKKFLEILKEPLKDGIKILFLAQITYDAVHGIALQILEIDPAYTMGDLEREKQETIDKLRAEDIFDRNKHLPIPLLPKRIAIISVESSKGYADFLSVINTNQWQYTFFHFLFPSVLQGEKAIDGIVTQLNRIQKVLHHFDVVAIVRGGGGDVGLSCYNNYRLSKAIAEFPLPVLTGIGHATNETAAEMVSHFNAITPTKLAEFLIYKFREAAVPVEKVQEYIISRSRRMVAEEQLVLKNEVRHFRSSTAKILIVSRNFINEAASNLKYQWGFTIKSETGNLHQFREALTRGSEHTRLTLHREIDQLRMIMEKDLNGFFRNSGAVLTSAERQIEILSPENVLRRGYSITLYRGKPVTDADNLSPGDPLETILARGTISSITKTLSTENE